VVIAGLASAAGRKPLPARLRHVGNARQVLIVQAPYARAHHGSIQGWQRDRAGRWHKVIALQRANLGLRGLVPGNRRVQDDERTPEGTYRLTFAFGIRHNPGSHLPYKHLDRDDYWPGDQRHPRTYNVFQDRRPRTARWSTASSEHLVAMYPAYRYAVNIDWNLPRGVHTARDGQRVARHPANTHLGYAIFLHTFGTTGRNGYTLGCVAVDPGQLARILRWLRPALHPRIVIGTSGNITRQ
jgi:L,D-peptidoglycan transpeptidase YkuD (ErfK/YbiS/YcfS/YnhG family)